MPSSGQRILVSRPQDDAIRRNISKLADEFQICCFIGAIAPQIPARPCALERLRSGLFADGLHLCVLAGLLQNRAPKLAFTFGHGSPGESKVLALVLCGCRCADLLQFLEFSQLDQLIRERRFHCRLACWHGLPQGTFRIALHQESEDDAVRRVTMRAAKNGIPRRPPRTGCPRVPGTVRPNISYAFHWKNAAEYGRPGPRSHAALVTNGTPAWKIRIAHCAREARDRRDRFPMEHSQIRP